MYLLCTDRPDVCVFVTMAKVNNMICAAAPEDVFLIIELKKRLARIGIRRPNSQLGPALRLTTGRDNFYICSIAD